MASLTSGPVTGGGSVSSLVKSASTLASEIATFNDTVAANAFANDHSDGPYNTYNDYLAGRIKSLQASGSVSDQTKAASLSQTQITALKANRSFNIQTTTIAVLDGTATPQDKLTAIGNAFQILYSVGDVDAAQQYESQYYSYSQTLQLQQQQAADALASAAKTAESSYSSAVTAGIDTIKNNIQNANAAFAATGPKFLDDQSNAYLKTQVEATGSKANGSASIFAALGGQIGMTMPGVSLNTSPDTRYNQGTYTPGSELDLYTQAIVGDPTKEATYKSEIDSILNGATGISLPGEGNKSISYSALMNTIYAGNSGNAPYGLTKGADGSWNVQAEKINGYTFGKDQNGNTMLMPSYSMFTPSISSDQKKAFAQAGVNFKDNGDGTYTFQATNQDSFIGKALGTNQPVQGVIQKDGTTEFMSNGKLLSMVKDQSGKYGFQQINQFGQVVNSNVAGQYGFTPPANQINVVKGSTAFMTKVLGDTATPTEVNGKTIYQSNGKLYQLATDTKGLKALQEIDKTGKVINNNVAGQYGFNPNSLTRGPGDGTPDMKGTQFIQALSSQHEQYVNGLLHADNPGFKDPDGISAFSPGWLGVQSLINNAQMIQTVNQAHNLAMISLTNPPALPKLSIAPPPAAPVINVAPSPKLQVAASGNIVQPASTKSAQILQPTANPQGGNVNPQGGGVNGFNLNQSGSGGIKL